MLQAIVHGETDPAKLIDLAKGILRKKIPQLKLALEGNITEHHRFLLRQWLDMLDFLEGKIAVLEQEIVSRSRPFEDTLQAWVCGASMPIAYWPRSEPTRDSFRPPRTWLPGPLSAPATGRARASKPAEEPVTAIPGCVARSAKPPGPLLAPRTPIFGPCVNARCGPAERTAPSLRSPTVSW